LSYGDNNSQPLTIFIGDLAKVARAFSIMAAHYLRQRVIEADWTEFVRDVQAYARFPLPYNLSEI